MGNLDWMWDINNFSGPVINCILNFLLNALKETMEKKDKKELAKYLVRLYVILDSFSENCEKVSNILSNYKTAELIDNSFLVVKFNRMEILLREFEKLILEFDFIKFYGEKTYELLNQAYWDEVGLIHLGYIDQIRMSEISVTPKGKVIITWSASVPVEVENPRLRNSIPLAQIFYPEPTEEQVTYVIKKSGS